MLCFSLGLIGLISGIGLLVAAAYNAYVIWTGAGMTLQASLTRSITF